jgi:hypothetical protein
MKIKKTNLIVIGILFGYLISCIVGILYPILYEWLGPLGYEYFPIEEAIVFAGGILIITWLLYGTLDGIIGGLLAFLLNKKKWYRKRFLFAATLSLVVGGGSFLLEIGGYTLYNVIIASVNSLLFAVFAITFVFLVKPDPLE